MLDRDQIAAASHLLRGHWRAGTKLADDRGHDQGAHSRDHGVGVPAFAWPSPDDGVTDARK
jgi:hypothetical protein